MLFELEGVTKNYGSVTALRDLSVSMPKGAIGLLGPNGAGKTTMIRTLLGLVTLDKGGGTVLGMDIRRERLAIRAQVGFLPEDECIFPGMTGIEFVAFAGELSGLARKDSMQRAHEVLDYAGLLEQRYRPVDSYSTGMKQRIKLAAALVHDPKLVIMDEPTNGLDPKGRDDLLALARDLAYDKGISLIFSSHLLPDVEFVCERILVMSQGQVLTSGRVAEMKEKHEGVLQVRVKENEEAFASALELGGCGVTAVEDHLEISLAPGTDEATVWRIAATGGFQIRWLRPRRSTLEEVFLSAVEA
jgi:ABC-2 type transport system ATP-binding protein